MIRTFTDQFIDIEDIYQNLSEMKVKCFLFDKAQVVCRIRLSLIKEFQSNAASDIADIRKLQNAF